MKKLTDFITGRHVARMLEIPPNSVPRVVEAAGIRKLVIPGRNTRYHAGDVEDVLAKSIQGAGRKAEETIVV